MDVERVVAIAADGDTLVMHNQNKFHCDTVIGALILL